MLKRSNFIFGLLKQWGPKWSTPIIALLCLLILSPPLLHAQKALKEETLPSLELIAFLGFFEDDDMGWVDPLELMKIDDKDFQEFQDKEADGEE